MTREPLADYGGRPTPWCFRMIGVNDDALLFPHFLASGSTSDLDLLALVICSGVKRTASPDHRYAALDNLMMQNIATRA